ncbi:hypothetical protein CEXT_668261 [Caerostris extrusa]|uniref:Uncharacterized protein n=1 Tax=Caerostris extrusa TaxID=172846 RepID=A0AAV4Q9V4_CAEEX|nr:hypothetical protein CEXT_668261 [Caerostris extrusa]
MGFVAYTSLPAEPHNPLSLTTISFHASLPQISEWWDSLIVGQPSHRDVRIVTEPKDYVGNKGTVVFMISEWWDSLIVGKSSHRDVRIVTEPKIMWLNKGNVVFMMYILKFEELVTGKLPKAEIGMEEGSREGLGPPWAVKSIEE